MGFQVYLVVDLQINGGQADELRFCLRMVYLFLWDSNAASVFPAC